MPGIGVVLNPHSKRYRKAPHKLGRMAFIVGERGDFRATHDLDDLQAVADKFKAKEIEILALSGGDGTNHRTLTAFIQAYRDQPLPKIALLRGGTLNTVAASCGIYGTPEKILMNLIYKYHSGEPFQTVPLYPMRIITMGGTCEEPRHPPNPPVTMSAAGPVASESLSSEGDKPPHAERAPGATRRGSERSEREGGGSGGLADRRGATPAPYNDSYGFIWGCGVIYRFMDAYYRGGVTSPARAAWTLVHSVTSALANGRFACELFARIDGTVSVNDMRWPYRNYSAIYAGSISQLGLNFRVFYLAGKPGCFHGIGFSLPPRNVLRYVPKMFLGRPSGCPDLLEQPCREMRVELAEPAPYTIDGDMYEPAAAFHITPGPALEVIVQ